MSADAELPDDPWSHLLVGHQWPRAASLSALRGAAANRSTITAALDGYADVLAAVRQGPLTAQEGATADALRQRFGAGERMAREASRRNFAKHTAYNRAHDHVAELRAELSEIARTGTAAISTVVSSADPPAAKAARITEVVLRCQTAANLAGAKHTAAVLEAVQQVLAAADPGARARQFADAHGVDVGGAFGSPSRDAVANAVGGLLRPPAPGPARR